MKPKNPLLVFTLAASCGLGLSLTASAQTTYTLPTTTGAWNWTSTALGGTGWADNSSATGSIADLRGWNGGSAAATITSSESRLAYQLIMDQADAGGRRVLGGGNAASNLTIGAGGIINAATSGTTVDVRTQVTVGANQSWEAGLGGNNTLIMDFRPSSSDATKLNLGGNNLTIGDRVSLQFDLGNTVTTPYSFIGSGSSGTITAGGSGNTGTIGIGSQELQNNETLDLTGATLAVTSANRSGITFGRGGQPGTIIKIDGLSGTSALSTHRGGITFNTSSSVATTTTVQLVGSGNYTIDARIQDSNTPFAGSALLIQKTGSGNQTFAGAGTAATGGGSWNSSAALQVDAGRFIISGDKNGTGAMTVNTTGTLIVDGTAAGSTTVNAGGKLAGHGTVAAITLTGGASSGGVLDVSAATGSALGDMNATSLIWNGTDSAFSQMKFDLGSSNASDKLILSGNMTKGTGSIFEWDFGGTGVLDNTYTLVTAAGGFGSGASLFTAGNFSYKNLASGLTGSFSISGSNLQFATSYSPIPEPTSALAGLLITAGLLRRRRG